MHLEHADILEQRVAQCGDVEQWEPIPIVEDPVPENPRIAEDRERAEQFAAQMRELSKNVQHFKS